jgi:hypothetical protein
MSIVALQVFVSLTLVAGSIVLFLFSVRQRDFEHADRLALAPLEEDRVSPAGKEPCTQPGSNTTTP